jgi:isopenicillin N synthase-like dioxygenase
VSKLLARNADSSSFLFLHHFSTELASTNLFLPPDYLKSTLHRVTLPPVSPEQPEGAKGLTRARYSIPYFVSPDPEAIIECLPACASGQNPPKYPPVLQDDYRKLRAKLQYSVKSEAAAKSVAVS